MKTILFGAAAAVAVMSAAGIANAQEFTTGYVGGSYSTVNTGQAATTTTLAIDDATVLAARAVGSFQLQKGVEVQLDGDIASVDIGYPHSSSVTLWGGTAHVFVEGENGSKVGAILSYIDADSRSVFTYGLEGRFAATDNISFGFGAIWGSVNLPSASAFNEEVRSYDGEASFFINDNFRLDAGINSFRVSNSTTGTVVSKNSVLSYRAGGEIQLENMPVAFTFGYASAQASGNKDYDSFSLGVRRLFGGTLKDRDRSSSPFHGGMELLGGAFGAVGIADDVECDDSSNEDACDISTVI